MNLLASWRASLKLFIPGNFKLFLLATINALGKTYKALLNGILAHVFSLFTLILLFAVGYFAVGQLPYQAQYGLRVDVITYLKAFAVYFGLWFGIACCAAARASVIQKNGSYYRQFVVLNPFSVYFWLFWACVILYLVGYEMLFYYFLKSHAHASTSQEFFDYTRFWRIAKHIFALSPFRPFIILFILFSLDSDGTCAALLISLRRAITMFLYNLPLIFLMSLALLTVTLPIAWLLSYFSFGFQAATPAMPISPSDMSYMVDQMVLSNTMRYILSAILLLPLVVTVWSNIYIKRLHDDSQLYFSGPKTS